ncbi:hypothetical protein GIB67_039226 [Kingdonia uniflora]|uniref:CCHC-type domain-containing protein n=1 Tax=Kingdonia uniflora TaxID=39325 RepID=A0A7J7MLU2_9MAGN|nr:hypothetical protein GIB67_039226 [Kingdonia uniflora]
MEINVKCEAPDNHLDQERRPLLGENKIFDEQQTPIQRAINQTFKSTAHLANLLPTGSVLAFQLLAPIFTNQGMCDTVSRSLTAGLITLCGISCFILCLTDSFRDGKGKVVYGLATFKGLWVIDGSGAISPELAGMYRLKFIDFLHAFMSILVFAAVALFDQNVVNCFYPTPSEQTKELLTSLPVGIGVICSMMKKKLAESDPKYDSMVRTWLINSMQPTISAGCLFTNNAHLIWESLRKGTQTLGMYYARHRSSWEELSHYDSFIEWPASTPSENVLTPPTAAEIYAKIVEKTRVTHFPTLEEAHAYCLSDQSRRSPMPPISGIPSETYVRVVRYAYPAPPSVPSQTSHTSSPSLSPLPAPSGNSRLPRKRCNYCGKWGHLKTTCHALHGRPAGYQPRPSQSSAHLFANSSTPDSLTFSVLSLS